MAKRNDRQDQQLKKQVTKQASTAITIAALVALVACTLIHSLYQNVPDLVFWILAAAIVPDAIKLLRGDKQ